MPTRIPHARILTCPAPGHCDGYYVAANLPLDHPQAGQLLPCACTRARQATGLQAGLPLAVRRMTLATFQVSDDNRAAVEHARRFADQPWGQGWFFLTLFGPNRQGKTHLAAAVVNALLARGEPAWFEPVPALLDALRAGYGDGSFYHRLEQVKTAQVLVLDDLGAESCGGAGQPFEVSWAQDKLYQVVDHRLVQELPTVFTTNLVPDKLPPRTASRMWDRRDALAVALAPRNGGRRDQPQAGAPCR